MTEAEGLAAASAWLAGKADRTIETHIGQVFLIGEHAFKLKKAVNFGYLDFSTRADRSWAIERELGMNSRAAPDLYQAVRWITREADGRLAFDGEGEKLEAVLQMRRFDPDGVVSKRPELVEGEFAEALGRQVARYHAGAEVRPGGAATLGYVVQSNAAHLRELADGLGRQAVDALIAATQAEFERRSALLDARGASGQVRDCHGDLHLGNILAEDGKAVLFDCIEFNDRLSRIDVLYDLAFLLMDLGHRGQAAGANRVLNGYLDEAARTFGDEALRGLATLPLFLSVRAAVRVHVGAHMGKLAEARAYLDAALGCLEPAKPSLTAVGGLSGSGKSTFARKLAPGSGAAVLRSDEVRKRLWGRAPAERLPPEAYADAESARVYGRMLDEARLVLQAGRAVVLDAVFLKPAERAAVEALAVEMGVPFDGVWLEAPPDLMAERLRARSGDASDADERVLQAQLGRDPGEVRWRRISSG
jgi:aminoglycoside phosphotransferase family enzyme/predicted kinase